MLGKIIERRRAGPCATHFPRLNFTANIQQDAGHSEQRTTVRVPSQLHESHIFEGELGQTSEPERLGSRKKDTRHLTVRADYASCLQSPRFFDGRASGTFRQNAFFTSSCLRASGARTSHRTALQQYSTA